MPGALRTGEAGVRGWWGAGGSSEGAGSHMPVNPQPCLMCSHCVFASESEPAPRDGGGQISQHSDHQILRNATSKTILIMRRLPTVSPLAPDPLSAPIIARLARKKRKISRKRLATDVFLAWCFFSPLCPPPQRAASLCCSVIKQCV